MFLMFGDEADREQASEKKFFVYGAIFVPIENLPTLHDEIEKGSVRQGHTAPAPSRRQHHRHQFSRCPLYPQKRTCAVQLGMSALCQ
jgi:hypothetical protein